MLSSQVTNSAGEFKPATLCNLQSNATEVHQGMEWSAEKDVQDAFNTKVRVGLQVNLAFELNETL